MEKMEKCRFHPQILHFDQNESYFRDSHQILGKTVVFKSDSEKLGSCKNGKMGKRRFHPKLLDFDQEESHFRDFYQILGQTVVF